MFVFVVVIVVVVLVFVVLVLGGTALAALPWFLNTPAFQTYIAQSASQALGRSVRFASLTISPFPLPTVRLRRLQVAAEAGQCHGFAIRPLQAARNASPAPLRIAIEPGPPRQLRVLKCRGANPPARPVPFATVAG